MSFDISEPTRLVWVDLQPGRPFPHDTRYVLVTASGMRTEQGQWWPMVNGNAPWAPVGRGEAEAPLVPLERNGGASGERTAAPVRPSVKAQNPAIPQSLKSKTVQQLIESLRNDRDPKIRAAAAKILGRTTDTKAAADAVFACTITTRIPTCDGPPLRPSTK